MGVRFLESYLEKSSRNACYQVKIPDIVNDYKMNTGRDPVIVMDGMSCLRPLYGKLSWLNGGQFKEFYEVVQKFINNFTELGCSLVVYFDGPVQEVKLPVWKKRRIDSAETISALFDDLHRGTEEIERDCRCSCLPNGIGWIFLLTLSQHRNCRVVTSLKECDEEIARYAVKNKCFAILAQDTDYVIYNAALYYLSIKNLDLDKMETLCYDSCLLYQELDIPKHKLPLLASLLSNDIVPYDLVREFHNSLKRRAKSRCVLPLIADYIRFHARYSLSDIAFQVFGCSDHEILLRDSIKSYDLTCPSTKDTHLKEKEFPGCNGKWERIMQLAKIRYIESPYPAPLYDIVVRQNYYSSTCLEDYRRRNVVSIGNLLKKLRQYMYGILLYEKPLNKGQIKHMVEELVMTGFESMETKVMVEAKYLSKALHPGLLNLWTSKSEKIEDIKWDILSEIFNSVSELIKAIPKWLLLPALATKYFKDQYPDISEWELDALLATNVCVRGHEADDLAKLPAGPLTYRPIWIYSSVTRIYSNVNNLLFYIGDLIPLEFTAPYQYTDGKLFHLKYKQCKEKRAADYTTTICEHQVDNLELFHLLKSFVTSGHAS